MKNFFAVLTAVVVLLIGNITHAAKDLPALAEIDAENFLPH